MKLKIILNKGAVTIGRMKVTRHSKTLHCQIVINLVLEKTKRWLGEQRHVPTYIAKEPI